LRASGHGVSLLAPSAAGAALAGPGPSEVDAVLPWEAAPFARLFAGEGEASPEARRALSPFSAVIAYTSNTELVRGLARAAPDAQVVARAPLPPERGPHAARWLAEAVTAVGADPTVRPPLLAATEPEAAQARPWIERLGPGFLALHPGSGSPRKNWPGQRFASLVTVLAAGRPWLLVEGPADADAVAPAARLSSVVHAHGLPARHLGALLAHAGLYVGNDSGISHLAAAWGAPVVALFGPTNPAQWAPVGPRVKVLRAGDEKMESLEFEQVVRATREML
jgi:heptosyltransferase-3